MRFRRYTSVFMVLFYFISLVVAQTDLNISYEKEYKNISSKIQDGKSQNDPIRDHNFSDQDFNIRIALDHIFISQKNRSLEISEIVIFRNEGQEVYFNKDNHTFLAISTPLDIRDLKTQAMECCLVQEEGIVYMDPMQPIKPWQNFEMKISYSLIPEGTEYVFNKSAIYNTTSLSVLIDKKSGLSLEGSYDAITLAGIEYNVLPFNDLGAGEIVRIPVKITHETDYLYMGIGLFFIILTGLISIFRGKMKNRKLKEFTIEELELEKRKIFRTIYGFEKNAGTQCSDEFRKLMDEYRNKAIQISFKIDNLKYKSRED